MGSEMCIRDSDVAALKACCKYIKEHRIKHPIVYIMACRIGPFAGHFYKEIHKLGGTVYLNPDGAAVIIGTLFEENSQAKSAKLEVAA